MLTSTNVDFISCNKDSFKAKDGKTIEFQRVTFLHETDEKPITLTALTTLDFSSLNRYSPIDIDINLWMDANGYLKGKIVSFTA